MNKVEHQEYNEIDSALVKYLLGEANSSEKEYVEKWRGLDSKNEKYFQHFVTIWNQSKHLQPQMEVDVDKAWNKLVEKIEQAPNIDLNLTKPKSKLINLSLISKIAAILVIAIGGTWLYSKIEENKLETITASNTPIIHQLPDGTTVTLNNNSSLTYPKHFKGDTRSVSLKGEGFFKVSPDKTHPFIIDADKATITVVGTAFNVKSTTQKTEVIVEEGIVEVAKQEHAVRLLPQQKAIVYENKETPIVYQQNDILYTYYRTKEFVCNTTPLADLIEALNTAYNTNIVLDKPEIGQLKISTTFKDESLDEIVTVIATTLQLDVTHKDKQIILRKK